MQQHESILAYRSARYFRLALLVSAAAIVAYVLHEPSLVHPKPYGGTWLGYTLGTVGAVLIVWLMLLGTRKRRYRMAVGSVQGWTSAHVYLGTASLVVVTLHSAFEFGWNIHTLAYALMTAVIVTGFWGVYAYLRYPERMTRNQADDTPQSMRLKLAELDRRCRSLALDLPDGVNAVVVGATRAGERDLAADARARFPVLTAPEDCPTAAACLSLRRLGEHLTGEQAMLNQQLLIEMTRKQTLVERVRRHLRYQSALELWLYFHVPLSFALLAALIAHVVSVFYFW